MEDPFTSARSILSPPPKPSIFNNSYTNGVNGSIMNSSMPPSMNMLNNKPAIYFPPPPSQPKSNTNSFFGNHPGKK